MERPKSKKDIQRFLGMVTYNAKWIPDLSKKTEPLRQLLDKNVEWQWNHEQEKSWQLLRAILTTEPVLQYFDPERPIKISSDASKDGLGAVILQLHGNEWKPVAYASRSMTDAEKRYAQIEKELLGIAYGCCRFHQFIYGGQIIVETDHKPFVSLAKKPLNDCPLRIQRIMLQLQKYDLEINYTPGKYLLTADALSRAVDSSEKDSSLLTMQINAHVHSVIRLMPISNKRMNEVKEKTNNDDVLIELRNTIINGWPDQKRNCNPKVVDFWNVRDELSVADGIVLKGMKIVIPLALRQLILGKIHEGHMGIEKCKRRGREVVYWPDINDDIECMVRKCSTCLKYSNKQQREPLIPHELPNYPWQKVGSDLFMDQGKTYLIVTDYYSGYPEVMQLQTITSRAIVTAIKTIFARFGIPEVLISDNGPQYDCREFKEFSKEWDFDHVTSSPYYPKSNGLAENSVKTVKRMIKKCGDSKQDFYKAILAYRSSPLESGKSPVQLLMNRRIRSSLPIHSNLLATESVNDHTTWKIQKRLKQKHNYDRSSHSLPPLGSGDRVRVRDPTRGNWAQGATVTAEVAPRSYNIVTKDGVTLRRNRIDIRPDTTEPEAPTEVNDQPGDQRGGELHADQPRRSDRRVKAPERLIEKT